MKSKAQLIARLTVPPPAESMRDTVGERRSADHLSDPAWRRPGRPATVDNRPEVAAGGATQRIRARQTEARTAESCHVRLNRRPAGG